QGAADGEAVADHGFAIEALLEQFRGGVAGDVPGQRQAVELGQLAERHVAGQGEAAEGLQLGLLRGAALGEQPVQARRVLVRGDEVGVVVRLQDRKSTRLNSSHVKISYAVFCLKKKKTVSRYK